MGFFTRTRLTRACLAIFVVGTLVAACQSRVTVDTTVDTAGESSVADTRPQVSTTTPIPTTRAAPLVFAGLTVAALGDWYANDPDQGRYVQDAEQTRDAIIEAAPEVLLVLGDFSYDGHSPERFFEFVEPLEAVIPIYPAYGNHDGIVEGELTRPDFYRALREHFSVSEEWYSFEVGPIHFISINSEYPEGSDGFEKQFVDLSEDLAAASSNDSVKVIIPFFHRTMVNPVSPDGPDRTLQEFVYPLLDRYSAKIPLALQAHHHVYTRTHAISYSEQRNEDRCRDTEGGIMCDALHGVVDRGTGTNPTVYGSDGIVFVTVGTGGAFPTGRTPDGPYVAVRMVPVSTTEDDPAAGTFGYLHLTLDDELESIEGEYRANNGQVLDWFAIELP